MKKAFLIHNYSRLSDAKLNLKAGDIITALTDNLNFPITSPTIAALTLTLQAYNAALTQAAQGGKTLISAKNDRRAELLEKMRELAINVESLAEGNRTKMLSSGFDLASENRSPRQVTVPSKFQLSDGDGAGKVIATIKPSKNAKSYNYSITDDPSENAIWQTIGTTATEYEFSNLEVGKRVYCMVTAIGSNGQQASTAYLSRIVQ